MRLVLEVAHLRLVVDLSPACHVEEDEVEVHAHLGSDVAFGFAPDPVFPELDWGDDEERRSSSRRL